MYIYIHIHICVCVCTYTLIHGVAIPMNFLRKFSWLEISNKPIPIKVLMTDNQMTELEMFSDSIFYKLFITQKRKGRPKKGKDLLKNICGSDTSIMAE